jgi:hypothetical protein
MGRCPALEDLMMYEQERPFDYNRNPTFTPTKPHPAIGTLIRKMNIHVHGLINESRPRQNMVEFGRLCRINHYLYRREDRLVR